MEREARDPDDGRTVMTGPLAGVKVLDFSTTFSGPYCTQQLADFGADVVKVEAPGGDITRSLGDHRELGMASVFVAVNRGKSSIVLDLKDPAAQQVIGELIENADVLVHNMRPQAAEKLGIASARALSRNPRLVYAAITGYGTDGPYAGLPAYDDTIQASTGLAWLQGLRSEPTYVASAIADKVTGLTAAIAIVSALFATQRSGSGQAVEVPMFETMAAFNLMEQWGGRAFVPAEGVTGYTRMRAKHRRPYRTKDGMISVVAYHGEHWHRFLTAIGQEHLLELDRFRTTEARNENIDSLYELLAHELNTQTTDYWLELLDRIDVPAARVKSLDDLFDDEHLRAVDFFHEVGEGDDRYLAARSAVRFSGTPLTGPRDGRVPDRLGEGASRAASWFTR